MSVIMGINLLDKLYLISDSRETIQYEDHQEYNDDLIKAFVFSEKCSAVAAGKTIAASFLLNGILKKLEKNASIDDVIKAFEIYAKSIVTEFVELTNQLDKQVALIVAGFNDYKGKEIIASKLGDAMSGQLVKAGNGSSQQQGINNLIVEALLRAITKQGELSGDSIIKVQTINSKMYTVVVDIRTNNIEIDEIPCYQYAIFHPNQTKEKIELPEASISYLDFRVRKDSYSDEVIFEDTEHIISFLNKEIKRCGFTTVGGHILSLLQSPVGAVYPTGDIATIRDGRVVNLGSFFVDEKKGFSYRFANGKEGAYRHLGSIKKYESSDPSLV